MTRQRRNMRLARLRRLLTNRRICYCGKLNLRNSETESAFRTTKDTFLKVLLQFFFDIVYEFGYVQSYLLHAVPISYRNGVTL